MDQANFRKKLAGEKAAEFVKDGMLLGLGSGSTVYWTLKKLGELIENGMKIKGIPSSRRTERWAKEFGIPLIEFSNVERQLDLAIDGADEVDEDFNLIKGGGGSLYREKVVDAFSKQLIIIVDESKLVQTLGKFPLPVEVSPFGWEVTAQRISKLGCHPILRKKDDDIFITDNGNYILDCDFNIIVNPQQLHKQLKLLTGVVETGLFINLVDVVVVGEENGLRLVNRKEPK
ncbi:ribose-5-phosphate isomerase RpiA [Bacillus sp. Marseille-P3661]|uniref:ribose-5-phosphate isomerase RpiA n=1 Tax=Bacillus sp. Marseille-P3661 TaxID=1936234 RepID=UPI000C84C025